MFPTARSGKGYGTRTMALSIVLIMIIGTLLPLGSASDQVGNRAEEPSVGSMDSRADLVIGDSPQDEAVTIDTDTVIDGNIQIINNGSLWIKDCEVTLNGDITIENDGAFLVTSSNLTILGLWKGHRKIELRDEGAFGLILSTVIVNEIANVRMENNSSMGLVGVTVLGFMHYDIIGTADFKTESTILNAELVMGDHAVLELNNTVYFMVWLEFPPNSEANLTLGGGIEKTITDLRIGNESNDFNGIDYHVNITNSSRVMFGILALPLSTVRVIDTELRAVGNAIYFTDQDLSGFRRNEVYVNFQPSFSDRVQIYTNATIYTWNFYMYFSIFSLTDSVVGEVFAFDASVVTLYNTTVDGSGGHTEVSGGGKLICYDSDLEFLTLVHGDGYLEMNGGSLKGKVIVRDTAKVVLQDTSRKWVSELTVYDSALVTAVEMVSPTQGSYVPSIVDVVGTAAQFPGPDHVGSDSWDLSWSKSGASWDQLGSGSGVDNGELAVWNATSETEGTYKLRLRMGVAEIVHDVDLKKVLPSGNHCYGVGHDGLLRTYCLRVPTGYDGSADLPLVFVIHGGYGNGPMMERSTNYSLLADREGFFVIYPNGTVEDGSPFMESFHWNAGPGRRVGDIDDIGFFSKMIDRANVNLALDDKAVFATGISRGGFMSFKIGRDLSDRIAAIAPMAAAADPGNFTTKGPIPVMYIHGTRDLFAPFEGGTLEGQPGVTLVSANETVDMWEGNDLCEWDRTIFEGDGINTSFTARRNASVDGAPVEFWVVENGGHTWPGQTATIFGKSYYPGDYLPNAIPGGHDLGMISSAFSATEETWEFFKNRSKWIEGDNRPPEIVSYSPDDDVMVNESVNGTMVFDVEVTDPDRHVLNYTWRVNGIDQTVDNRTFTLNADHDSAGSYDVNVNITDGHAYIERNWSLIVNDVNRAPVITITSPEQVRSVNETQEDRVQFIMHAEDPDGDLLAFTWYLDGEVLPNETGNDHIFTYNYSSSGTYNITVIVSDGLANISYTWTFIVVDVDRAPVVDVYPKTTAKVGEDFNYTLQAYDPDGENLTFGLVTGPAGMSIDPVTGHITWIPTIDQIGSVSASVDIIGGNMSFLMHWAITVTSDIAPNNAPWIQEVRRQDVWAGDELVVVVEAFDADGGDELLFYLDEDGIALGVTIDNITGELRWMTTDADVGIHRITVFVTDGKEVGEYEISVEVMEAPTAGIEPVPWYSEIFGLLVLSGIIIFVVIIVTVLLLVLRNRPRPGQFPEDVGVTHVPPYDDNQGVMEDGPDDGNEGSGPEKGEEKEAEEE